MKKNLAIKLTKKDTEEIRRKLLEMKLIVRSLKIKSEGKHVYIPVKKETKKSFNSFCFVEKKFEKQNKKIKSYQEQIGIPDELKKFLPTSFDIVGDIVLIKIPGELKDYKKKIGEGILKTYKKISTVYNVSAVSGELRTRNLEFIAGEKKTKTTHKEHNVKLLVDVKDTYFSPRLANERKRIADLVKDGEVVVDMFTGVAPFPCVISRHSNPKMIIGVDKNKKAIELAEKNILKNGFLDKIDVFCKDAENVKKICEDENVRADRVIMNLPFSSKNFLENALHIVKNNFFIHIYLFLSEKEIEESIGFFKKIFSKFDIEFVNCESIIIKSYSPTEFYICFDITGKKKI